MTMTSSLTRSSNANVTVINELGLKYMMLPANKPGANMTKCL